MFSDILVVGWLLFLSRFVFFISVCNYASGVDLYYSAKKTEVGMELLGSICQLLSSCGYLYLGYNNNWQKLFLELKVFNKLKFSCYERYFINNVLLISNWLFYIPTIVHFIYILISLSYEISINNINTATSQAYLISWVILSVLILLIFFLFVWVSMPEFLQQNDCTGANFILYPFYACSKNKDTMIQCFRKYIGSDFTIGYWIFALTTFIFFIFECQNFENTLSYEGAYYVVVIGLITSILFVIATWILLYSTYPANIVTNNYMGPCYISRVLSYVTAARLSRSIVVSVSDGLNHNETEALKERQDDD